MSQQTAQVLEKLDRRVERIEQILPTLATREEMHAAIQAAVAPLATRAELQAAIEPLATKAELRAAIEPLATRAELQAVKAELKDDLKELRAELRTHFDAVAESLRGDIRLIAESVGTLQDSFTAFRLEEKRNIASLDGRVTRLEARRLTPRRRR